jgi:hypothetical protein
MFAHFVLGAITAEPIVNTAADPVNDPRLTARLSRILIGTLFGVIFFLHGWDCHLKSPTSAVASQAPLYFKLL